MIVKLNHGFFIEIDALNYTLCRKYKGKTRDGQEKEAVKTCGHFGSIRFALKEYLRLMQLEYAKDETLYIDEFMQAIDKSNEAAVEEIVKRIDRSGKKRSNGDRIRGMSDAELAEFLSEFSICKLCECYDEELDRCWKEDDFMCIKETIIRDWLNNSMEG